MASTSKNLSTVPSAGRILATNEKVTGPAGVEMIIRSELTTTNTDTIVLDNACGGGVITAELLRLESSDKSKFKIKQIVALDKDESMTESTLRRKDANSWDRVTVVTQDQQETSLSSDTFTHIFNNFGIFFADSSKVLSETLRLLQPGGVAGFTSWKALTWWTTLALPAMAKQIPEAPELPDPNKLFPDPGWADSETITQRVGSSGFVDVQVYVYEFTPSVDAEEFAEACAFLVNVAAKRTWPADEYAKHAAQIQPALLRYLLESYPDGRWTDKMKANVTIARKP